MFKQSRGVLWLGHGAVMRNARYIAELEAEIERLRFAAWSLSAFVLALILALATVK